MNLSLSETELGKRLIFYFLFWYQQEPDRKWTFIPITNQRLLTRPSVVTSLGLVAEGLAWKDAREKCAEVDKRQMDTNVLHMGPKTPKQIRELKEGQTYEIYFGLKTRQSIPLIYGAQTLESENIDKKGGDEWMKRGCSLLNQITNSCIEDMSVVSLNGPYFFITWILFSPIQEAQEAKFICRETIDRDFMKSLENQSMQRKPKRPRLQV